MNLLELFETGIYQILPFDLHAILMLSSTSIAVKNIILHMGNIPHKVYVRFKKSDYLYLHIFSQLLKKFSVIFTIDKLDLRNCKIQKSVYTINPKQYLNSSYENFTCDENFTCENENEKVYEINYLDIIDELCPSLTFLTEKKCFY
jgi:hypothetical protein